MTRLSHKDIQTLMNCIPEIYSDFNPDGWHSRLLSVISKAIPSNLIVYSKINLLDQKFVHYYNQMPLGYVSPKDVAIFEKYMHEHPVMKTLYPNQMKSHPFKKSMERRIHHRVRQDCIRHPEGSALKISDFLTNNQFRRLGLYNEFFRKYDIEYQMMGMPLSCRFDTIEAIAVNRACKDFTERDRLMLNLLAPHIIKADSNAKAVSAIQRNVQASAEAKAIDNLTLREAEALHWVAQGKGNATIAAIMQVKECTVKKHLENIFAKLGVENRVAAARVIMEEFEDV